MEMQMKAVFICLLCVLANARAMACDRAYRSYEARIGAFCNEANLGRQNSLVCKASGYGFLEKNPPPSLGQDPVTDKLYEIQFILKLCNESILHTGPYFQHGAKQRCFTMAMDISTDQDIKTAIGPCAPECSSSRLTALGARLSSGKNK
jgi:hypothetical protein